MGAAKESRRQDGWELYFCPDEEEVVGWGGRTTVTEATMGGCCFGNQSSFHPVFRSRSTCQTMLSVASNSRDRSQRPVRWEETAASQHTLATSR